MRLKNEAKLWTVVLANVSYRETITLIAIDAANVAAWVKANRSHNHILSMEYALNKNGDALIVNLDDGVFEEEPKEWPPNVSFAEPLGVESDKDFVLRQYPNASVKTLSGKSFCECSIYKDEQGECLVQDKQSEQEAWEVAARLIRDSDNLAK